MWQINFNTCKCSVIVFGNSKTQYPKSTLNSLVLNIVDSINYLGVNAINAFNWGDHVVKK